MDCDDGSAPGKYKFSYLLKPAHTKRPGQYRAIFQFEFLNGAHANDGQYIIPVIEPVNVFIVNSGVVAPYAGPGLTPMPEVPEVDVVTYPIYYGVSPLKLSAITALITEEPLTSNRLAGLVFNQVALPTRLFEHEFDCSAGEGNYIYILCDARFGTGMPAVTSEGFPFSAFEVQPITISDSRGEVKEYIIIKTGLQFGNNVNFKILN